MLTEIEVEGIGTLRHLNNWQIARMKKLRGDEAHIAAMAFGLGMTVPQFKRDLTADEREAVRQACCRLMSADGAGLGPVRRALQPPAKGEHVPIERQVWLGQRLLEVKAKLPRGHFRRWVEDHSGISWTQASRFIQAANATVQEAAQREEGSSRTVEPETADARQRADMGQIAA
jgi:hypothetical protein